MIVEGVHYAIDWENFTIGSSFFIPCVDDVQARERIETKMRRLRYYVIIKLVIEDGIRGLRVWRTNRYNKYATHPLLSPLS